jgi:hypothetical protein
VSNTQTTSDSTAKSTSFGRAQADTSTTSDNLVRQSFYGRFPVNTNVVSDAVAAIKSVFKSAANSFTTNASVSYIYYLLIRSVFEIVNGVFPKTPATTSVTFPGTPVVASTFGDTKVVVSSTFPASAAVSASFGASPVVIQTTFPSAVVLQFHFPDEES